MRSVRLLPVALCMSALPAEAHVKWFAPYIVGASPQPLSATLTDRFFWLGIGLVLAFFIFTRLAEPTRLGSGLTTGMTRISAPMDARLDDFLRAAVAAFFVAVFSVGGIYLTPDLKTDNALIPWMQLIIALCIFFRPTMPLAALGVVGLWAMALQDYDLFHLLDYLALGLGVAGYPGLRRQIPLPCKASASTPCAGGWRLP